MRQRVSFALVVTTFLLVANSTLAHADTLSNNGTPVTLATITQQSSGDPFQRYAFATQDGVLFDSYCDSQDGGFTTPFKYKSSIDSGITWSVTGTLDTGLNGNGCQNYSLWYDDSYVYSIGSQTPTCTNSGLCYKVSAIIGRQSLNTGVAHQVAVANNLYLPSITTDSNRNLWITASEFVGTGKIYVFKCSCTGQANFVNATGFPLVITLSSSSEASALIPLLNGKVAFLYQDTAGAGPLNVKLWDGTAWGTTLSTVSSLNGGSFSAVGVNNDVQIVFTTGTQLQSVLYHSSTNSFDPEVNIVVTSGTNVQPTLSYDATISTYFVIWADTSVIRYSPKPLSDTAWGAVSKFADESVTNMNAITSSYKAEPVFGHPDILMVTWVTGTVAPFNLRYMSFQIAGTGPGTVPQNPNGENPPFFFTPPITQNSQLYPFPASVFPVVDSQPFLILFGLLALPTLGAYTILLATGRHFNFQTLKWENKRPPYQVGRHRRFKLW